MVDLFSLDFWVGKGLMVGQGSFVDDPDTLKALLEEAVATLNGHKATLRTAADACERAMAPASRPFDAFARDVLGVHAKADGAEVRRAARRLAAGRARRAWAAWRAATSAGSTARSAAASLARRTAAVRGDRALARAMAGWRVRARDACAGEEARVQASARALEVGRARTKVRLAWAAWSRRAQRSAGARRLRRGQSGVRKSRPLRSVQEASGDWARRESQYVGVARCRQ